MKFAPQRFAKEMLEEFSKLESEDASSEEAKKALEYKDKLKTASEAEEGEWCEPVNGGCMEIFDEIEKMEKKLKEAWNAIDLQGKSTWRSKGTGRP